MASSSNPRDTSARIEDLEYLYASNANVSNFVSVKLSSKGNYRLWKTQMICLMKSHNMGGIVDAQYKAPRASSKETLEQYDNLLKGWIFGSVSENVLGAVVDLDLAKDVWDRLKSFYGATIDPQQDLGPSKSEGKTETKEKNGQADTVEIEIIGKDLVRTETETELGGRKERNIERLRAATAMGNWLEAEFVLKDDKGLAKEAIIYDGSTMLRIAVEIGHIDFVKELICLLKDEEVLVKRSRDGFTALHIAANVGNKIAVDLLVKGNSQLLLIEDNIAEIPLHKAYNNMHIDTIAYLLEALDGEVSVHQIGVKIAVLLVNAIYAKQYNLASMCLKKFPELALENDEILMALAKTFPNGLQHEEQLIYPSFDNISVWIESTWTTFLILLSILPITLYDHFFGSRKFKTSTMWFNLLLCTVPFMIGSIFVLIFLLVLAVCFSFLKIYYLLWKGLAMIVPYVKHIENKKKEFDGAQKILELVCDEIDKLNYSGTHHPHYNRPVLEAACNNALEVVVEIFYRATEAIHAKDESGYDVIQLAVMNRSEKIYNLIYEIGERKNIYRTILDASKNNTLHLASRLAPSHALNKRTGAALQLQRELQWREEVKKLVYPTYLTQENIFKETPDMVFRREHANLVKEGEQWMKTTAESCSITAALITTVVFAAAITVPGGNQDNGVPMFKERNGFVIFAVSNAISLFSSSTALLVFLSILTARYAEKDFLVSLPRRLLIGVFTLLVSASTMMIAFTSILYLVFCDQKSWMLVPICGLALIPVVFFAILQFPLIIDLFFSTNMQIFGKRSVSVWRRFNPDDIRLIFVK